MINSIPSLNDILIQPKERGAIIGQTGCGKTVLAKSMLKNWTGKLCIIDPKRMIVDGNKKAEMNTLKVESVTGSLKAIKLFNPKRFVFQPSEDNLTNIEMYNELFKYLYDKKNFLVYIDDMLGIMERNKYPHYLQVCYQMGRQRGMTMLTTVQRPTWLPLFLLSEADRFYCFNLLMPEDIKRVASLVPGYNPVNLPRYAFYYYNNKGHDKQATIMKIKK